MAFTDEQPFLDAIAARYQDDGPRLVYADYLDDAGDPARGELVRVQVALARMPDDHPRRAELIDRQDELIAAHSGRWTEHLRGLVVSGEFRRGVLDSVVAEAATFLETGEELFRRARVRRVRLLDSSAVVPKLAASPLLARVRELDLCANELGDRGVELLARSPHLARVHDLNLADNWLGDAGVRALARASTLPALTSLALNDNEAVTAAGVKELAESPFLAGLAALDLSRDDVGEDGVRVVVASTMLPRLHTLRLVGNPIGDPGVTALAGSGLFARMVARSPRVELRANAIGPEGAAALAASPALARCTTLDLTGNYLGDAGLAALLKSPHLQKLHTLKLGGNQIADAGLQAVRDLLPGLIARLRGLDLSANRLTRYGLGLLEAARGESAAVVETTGNVQSSPGGEAPVPVGRVVPEVLRGVNEAAAAAELRRRVSHPRARPGDRPNAPG